MKLSVIIILYILYYSN